MELLGLLKQTEGKTLEFKRDLSSPNGIIRSVVAFANTSGGTLIIGVEDATRRIRGVADPLLVEERLMNFLADSIRPTVIPEVEVVPWRQTQVLVVRVHPSYSRPHYVRALGPEKGVYVRVGSTNRLADQTLIEELRRFARNESFDEQPIPELNSEAVDFRAASEFFSSVRKLRRADLSTLRIITTYQGRKVPTVGGILLFGVDREERFPDAWIQVGRFLGTDRRRILDHSEIHDLPVAAIEATLAFVRRNTAREAVIRGSRRVDRWTYPPVALREAVINAVVHADYAQSGAPIRLSIFDDRLEIENPGLLPFGLTIEDIQLGVSKLRNRVMGRVFKELGLIEQWGSGIQRMRAACEEAGLQAPVFQEVGMHFRVTLITQRRGAPSIEEVDQKVLEALSQEKGLSTSETATILGLSARATRTRLASLVARGLAVEVGTSANDPRRRYFLAAPS